MFFSSSRLSKVNPSPAKEQEERLGLLVKERRKSLLADNPRGNNDTSSVPENKAIAKSNRSLLFGATAEVPSVPAPPQSRLLDVSQRQEDRDTDFSEPPENPKLARDISTDAKKVGLKYYSNSVHNLNLASFLKQLALVVCRDKYVSMIQEKEELKRRMTKHEISSREYRAKSQDAALHFQSR